MPLVSLHLGIPSALASVVQAVLGSSVKGVCTLVFAKHTKSFNLVDTLSVGADCIQRNFEPKQHQVESWRLTQITDAQRLNMHMPCILGSQALRRAE